MRKTAVIVFAVLFLTVFLPLTASAKPLDEIQEYTITVDVRDDGTMDIKYHIVWKVLDSTAEGPLEWVKIGIPNKYVDTIAALSDNIKDISYYSEGGDFVRIDFNKSYNADEVLDIDFSIHQSYMYKINYSDSTVSYRFTPGWFEEINVNAIKILWNSKNVASSDCETTDGDYLVWSGSLAAGEKKTVNISYKTSALNVDPEKQNENSVFISDNNETITSWIGIILVVGILVLQFVRKTRSKYKGGFGRSGHIGSFGGHCACASSCACACAGGGRAGCSAKNFYGASVDAEKLKKAINRK